MWHLMFSFSCVSKCSTQTCPLTEGKFYQIHFVCHSFAKDSLSFECSPSSVGADSHGSNTDVIYIGEYAKWEKRMFPPTDAHALDEATDLPQENLTKKRYENKSFFPSEQFNVVILRVILKQVLSIASKSPLLRKSEYTTAMCIQISTNFKQQ